MISDLSTRNPDFDDDRVIWNDAYSGVYAPVAYDQQFDDQWRLFLERKIGFCNHTGVDTSDEYIDDRICELTGVDNYLLVRRWGAFAPVVSKLTGRTSRRERRAVGGRLHLDPKFPIDFFRGKRCLDVACGPGRWTRALMALGAHVKAMDVSKHALESVRRYTDDVEHLNVFDIPLRHDLQGAFDFVLGWGIIMHTHDPRLAFQNIAGTVRPGGSLYIAVYAPTYHASEFVRHSRKRYHREFLTAEEKLQFVYDLTNGYPENAINNLDMLNTFYNWTINEATIEDWCLSNGFTSPVFLNQAEPNKCQHHVLTSRAVY
jgi:2-polyprenyl-3-methyl-5-hydroxy-6-metoxy-1,4-benzoquinol methylase